MLCVALLEQFPSLNRRQDISRAVKLFAFSWFQSKKQGHRHIVERFPEKYRHSMTISLSKRPKENKQSLLCQKDCSNAVHIFCSNTENNEYHPTSAWGNYTWHHFHSHKGHTLDHSLGCQEWIGETSRITSATGKSEVWRFGGVWSLIMQVAWHCPPGYSSTRITRNRPHHPHHLQYPNPSSISSSSFPLNRKGAIRNPY